MAVYADAETLYNCVQQTFDRIQAEVPAAFATLADAGLVIRFRCTQPEAAVVINGRTNPVQTLFGETAVTPTLDIELAGDTLHQIMLGELAILKALGQGKLKVKGPMLKAKALAPLFYHSQTIYPEVLRACAITG